MRPGALPDSTSETVVCETPARRATSTLVTLARVRGWEPAIPPMQSASVFTDLVLRSTVLRMTRTKSNRGRRLASAGAAVALAAGLASGALAAGDAGPQTTDAPRIAVVATV